MSPLENLSGRAYDKLRGEPDLHDTSGAVGNRYIHGPGIDEPLGLIQESTTYYYHADGLGSITALSDAAQKVVQTYEYDSYGKLKDLKNRVKQPYTFTGREFDRETGMYYYRARYYDPAIGRFAGRRRLKTSQNT